MTTPMYFRPFPRFALVGAGILIALTIIIAATARIVGIDTYEPTAAVVVSCDMRFQDRPDGGVGVFNAADNSPLTVLAPGTNGFVRATLRGLARERRLDDSARSAPFRLTEYADGRLTLQDLGTGRRIDLEAFGQTNLQAFARLLPPPTAPRSAQP